MYGKIYKLIGAKVNYILKWGKLNSGKFVVGVGEEVSVFISLLW